MAFEVHTPLGLGTVTETDVVRGRTSYKVAGRGFDKWFDETEISRTAGDHSTERVNDDDRTHAVPSLIPDQRSIGGFEPYMDRAEGPVTGEGRHRQAYTPETDQYAEPDAFGAPEQDPHAPYGGVPEHGGTLSHEDQDAYGVYGDEAQQHHDNFGGSDVNYPVLQHEGQDPSYDPYDMHDPHGDDQMDLLKDQWQNEGRFAYQRQAWAPVNHDNSVNLPYNPSPQYPAIPGDTESTLQPIHGIDADERLSPADSITFEHRSDDESEIDGRSDNFAKSAAAPASWGTGGAEPGDSEMHEHWMGMNGDTAHEHESPYYDGASGGQWDAPLPYESDRHDGSGFQSRTPVISPSGDYRPVEHQGSTVHDAFAFLIPLAEGLAGAAGGGAAAGAAESAGAGAMGQAVARGAGSAATKGLMGGGEEDPAAGGGQEGGGLLDQTGPGEGWGPLISHGSAIDHYLASQEQRAENIGAGLSDRYIDLTASADFHNNPVAQFRHDPIAYIDRIAHVEYEPVSPEMEHYGQLVEANASIREAAWSDVRSKAMRLRREGRIAVKDVAPDRIYASVEGDHGTYEVMIAKEGAFGGFGGGHAISNWRCGCEWGRWAFQRRLTYIGRLCSHGYATYMEMQSAHTKGQPRQKKLTPVRKRADALQNEPQRLVPDLVINDTDDAHVFQNDIDVTKDERKDTGPDDIASEQDIVHFARVMSYCDRQQLPYPRELTSFLVRHADDDNPSDWRVEDASKAESALNEIRDWSDSPTSEDLGHLEERNDKVRDAVDEAREKGTDASLFTAGVGFRQAVGEGNKDRTPGNKPRGNSSGLPKGVTEDTTPIVERNNAMDTGGEGTGTYTNSQGRAVNDKGGLISGSPADNAAEDGVPYIPQNAESAARNSGGLPAAPGTPAPGAPGAPAGGEPSTKGAPGSYSVQNVQDAAGNAADRASSGPGSYSVENAQNAGGGSADKGVAQSVNGSPTAGQPGGSPAGGAGSSIGQGDYKIQSGDTLSDIAQRSGYGGDYNSLAQQNGISDPNKINAGDSLKIGDPAGVGGKSFNEQGLGAKGPGSYSAQDVANNADTPGTPAAATPATPAGGNDLNQNSGGPGADDAKGGAPATPPAAATPPAVDMSAIPGAASSGAGAATGVASTPPASPAANPATPSQDSSTSGGGAADATPDLATQASTAMDTVNSVMDTASSLFPTSSRYLFADQADYNEWHRFAYPDSTKSYNHTPFNGSGGDVSIEFGTSEEYADKARKTHDDVWDLEHHNVSETDERFRESGVKRLGGGPRRTVTPEVIREQRPSGAQRQNVQASMESFGSFDPLASRSPEDFDDVESAAVHTASQGGDFVAQFQQQYGASIMGNSTGGGGGHFDDFASSPAVREAMRRTAGRNYSLAEQHDLIREGDIGGAGNLTSLDLRGTHYEDDGVGLFT